MPPPVAMADSRRQLSGFNGWRDVRDRRVGPTCATISRDTRIEELEKICLVWSIMETT